MSSNSTSRKAGSRGSLLSGVSIIAAATAVLGGAQAHAQDEDEAIVVTGSRIPQPNLVTTSPVTQLTAEDITTAGVTRVEDMTNQLPQVFAAQGSNVSNGASGTAQVNLRGLGANRTLVLIDGHRMGYGSPNSAPADLNQIPGAMVERVEVLTGGASAVYGSDAVAGVVNFIMRDDFEGLRLDAQYGFFQHNNDSDDGFIREEIAFRGTTNPAQFQLPPDDVVDGYGKEITAIFGVSSPDGRGNVTAYMGYRSNDAVLQRDRDFSACAIGDPSAAARPYAPAGTVHWNCGGSATSFPGYFYFGPAFPGDPAAQHTIDQGTGNFVQFNPALNQYNFGPTNYYQRPDERYTLGAFARYEINQNAEAYAQAMFSDYTSQAQIAPSGDFFNTNRINCDNPFLPANIVATGLCTPGEVATGTVVPLYIARRNVEGGGRQDNLNYTSYRLLAGVRGAINESWDYDVSATYSRVSLSRIYNNDLSVTRLQRSLFVDNDGPDGVAGNADDAPTCESAQAIQEYAVAPDANCVPWNIFTPGGVTPDALNYLQIPLIQRGETIQQVVIGSLTGDLGFGSPMAESNFQTSFGIEYRRDELNTDTDSAFQAGDGAGQGGPTLPLNGDTDVFEVFGEARFPLIEGGAFAELLSVDVAYRYSDYNSGTTTDTYKVGGEWAPTDDIRFRASFQHATRAPNIIELFGAQGAGLFNMGFDPCDSDAPVPVPAICIGGAPYQIAAPNAALDNVAGQYNALVGGNPDLQPEEADTTTIGLVFTPTFVPGLNISLDWFNIDLTGAVAAPAASTVFSCYYQSDLDACANITRNPGNRRLWQGGGQVIAISTNIGGTSTTGWDINANYNMDIGSMGGLTFQLIGTLVDELNIDLAGPPEFNCAGLYAGDASCGTPTPEWRHRFRVNWETPWDMDFNLTWRYFSEVTREGGVPFPGDEADVNGSCGIGPAFNPNCNKLGTTLDATSYFDVAGSWNVYENTTFRWGVNNVLDTDPPLTTNVHTGNGVGNGNTFPQIYDSQGRWVFVGITVDF